MHESLLLFESILPFNHFKESIIVLFLSKKDIFKRKIREHPISEYWPDFEGPEGDYLAALTFFIDKFRALQQPDDNRELHIYVIAATDTITMKEILRDLEQKILTHKW